MEWMVMPLKRYAEFSGRSRRMEYWMYTLMQAIVLAVLYAMILSGGALSILTASAAAGQGQEPDLSQVSIGPMFWMGVVLMFIWGFGTIIPSLAVTVRRLHDRNMSGWWILGFAVIAFVLALIPVIGQLLVLVGEIMYIVVLALPGTSGANKYGDDPLINIDPEVFA
jgi:uncharacterized membrane protein YhaH (DUF805 family)